MKVNALYLKPIAEFRIFCLKKRSDHSEIRPSRTAWPRRMAAGVSIAAGLFAGADAMGQGTFTVSTTADSGSGSLRAAIAAANSSPGSTINFAGLTGTITLSGALPAITQSMAIAGPGAGSLTLSGGNAFQIFNISNSSATVAISGLTFVNGKSTGDGGAIVNSGMLTVVESTFSGNSATGGGGAIYNNLGILTVTNSTFSGNSATSIDGSGGAIYSAGRLTVTNSSFSGNSASFNGGAIGIVYGSSTATVTNSAFSGNSATGSYGGGGAIYMLSSGGTLTADNNIFTGNSATNSYGGAGIFNGNGTVNASYNLFYKNLDAGSTEDDCNGCTSNTNAIPGSNPNLLPLGYYGGPTETMLPQPGSPAICAGSFADVPSGVTIDQRGFPLTNSTCSNGGVDVGAVQSDYVQVTNAADSGAGSLRAAITAANGSSYGADIDFAPGVTGTITLASALPTITQSMAIVGPGAGHLTLSGNNAYQIFETSSSGAAISGLTLANATPNSATGGAIYNTGVLTVADSTFSGNSPLGFGGSGGAILNTGALTVTGSTFTENSAMQDAPGGAIASTGTLTVTGSTFSGNSASFGGGAIDVDFGSSTATVTGSTFSGNSAGNIGGAIFLNNSTSTLTVNNSIFTGNSAGIPGGGGAGVYSSGGRILSSYNLFYQNLDTGGSEDDCYGCTSNTNAIMGSNPLLGALGSYGGTTQTMLPQPGSPAICAGSTGLIPSGVVTDQRGFSRTTIYSGTACLDLGAVETDYTAVAFSSSSYTGVVNQNVNPAPVVTVTENGQNIGGVPITFAYSGSGSPTGLGPVTTAAGVGAAFSSLAASAVTEGTLSVSLPITASGNSVQPAELTFSAPLDIYSATQTITFAAPSLLTYGSAPILLMATGGASGNPVTFSLDATSTHGAATLSGSTLTITGVGTIVIDANQAGNSSYPAAAQAQQSIQVHPASVTITASSPAVSYGSASPAITPIFGTFFNGDTSAVLTTQPTCVTSYTATSAAGSLPSTSCSGAAAANYTFPYVNGSVTVNKATATIAVTPYSVTYDGNPHMATATATGVGGANLTADVALTGTMHTNAGSYASDAWSFTDPAGNYASASGTAIDRIAQATATISVTPYNATYNGVAHTATATATGIGGASLMAGLSLTGTAHTNAGIYATDAWSFADPAGNYSSAGGTVSDKIAQATATVSVTPYDVTYDGNPHTATATATGVGGANLIADLSLTGTAHTNAGTYASDAWSFTDPAGNYSSAGGTVSDSIGKAQPAVIVTPSSSSITTAQALTVTIAVGGGGNIPTGSVTLAGGGYSSGAVTLASGGATINIAAGVLATGSDTLTASFTPDSASSSNYNGASGTSAVTVTPPSTFAIGGGSSSLSITPGATTGNTVAITVTPANGFTGTVSLSCSISPATAGNPPACGLSPSSVTISGSGAQTSTLTVTTIAATTAENRLKKLLWPGAGTSLALVLVFGLPRRRRGWMAMVGVLALFVAIGAMGCGGGGSAGTASGGGGSGGNSSGAEGGGSTSTTPGTYTVTVTGTSGSVTGTVGTVSLTVQ